MKNFIVAALFSLVIAGCGDNKPPLSLNGEACEVNNDCESGDCRAELYGCHPLFGCSTFELDDGMCTVECTWTTQGTDDDRLQSDCGEGEQCLAFGDSPQICFQGCETDVDCREDYVCTSLGRFSTCLPPEDAARVVEEREFLTAAPELSILER